MKKFVAIILAVVLVVSCLSFSACFGLGDLLSGLFGDDEGGNTGGNGNNGSAGAHTHDFGDSYFVYTVCQVDGCNVVGRAASENIYAKDFVYTLTESKITEINATYAEILACLEDGDNYQQFETLYSKYLDYFDYVAAQYQVSSVLSDVTYNKQTSANFNTAARLYNDMFANYYKLYKSVYNSNYRNDFFDGWSESEIQNALNRAEIYGDSADNNNAVDDILNEYSDFMDGINWSLSGATKDQIAELSDLYGRLVEANNTIAKSSNYNDYMSYAYANEYYRDYTPNDVAQMRQYVKQYVAPIFSKVANRAHVLWYHTNFASSADKAFYYGLMADSLFADTSASNFNEVKTAIDYIGEYFKYVNRPKTTTGGDKVDFYDAVNDLFRNGNYFTGDYQGAYTWYIQAIDHPIVYFGLGDAKNVGYDTAFTFVHEFGHYYENIYNGSMSLSYDHDETHSQGNEMLFLSWLSKNKPSGVTNGFDMVECEQLFDMLANIVISTAVDEFEQAAYSGYYNGQKITGSYADLFTTILNSYDGADSYLNSTYWGYVVFDNPAYYISYAMSALPSLEIYTKAMSSGLYNARDSYVKLFTFANNSSFVTKDSYGNKHLTDNATYSNILNWCGLQGPFDLELYTSLQSYFNTRSDLQ